MPGDLQWPGLTSPPSPLSGAERGSKSSVGAEREVDRAELATLPDDPGRADAARAAALAGAALGQLGGGAEQIVAHREQALGEADAGRYPLVDEDGRQAGERRLH